MSFRQVWNRRPEARTHASIFGLMLAGTAVAAFRPTLLSSLPLGCVLRHTTGIRCPFCGMTTDFVAMLHGHAPHYQDANGRGNSAAIGWALGTFFCCPIVPIIYLIVGRKGTATTA